MESNTLVHRGKLFVLSAEVSKGSCNGCAFKGHFEPCAEAGDLCVLEDKIWTEDAAYAYVAAIPEDTDFVNQPPHYTSGDIECIDYIKDILTPEEFRGYLRGCMIKYQHRLMHKGSPQLNAEKIAWYGNKLIQEL